MWVSELLPWTAKMVDDLCFIRSMHTEAINHEPAITLHADRQPDHRPAVPGSWVSYGLGSLNDNLPTFVVLVARADEYRTSRRRSPRGCGQAGYLPGEHAGVSFRSSGRSDSVHQQSAGRADARSAAKRSMA